MDDAKKVIHRGWMAKKGHIVKNIKLRWFVLTPETLSYYKKAPSSLYESTPKGVIQLKGSTVTDRVEGSDKFSFLIETPEGKVFEITCNTKEDRTVWLKHICSQEGVIQSPSNKKVYKTTSPKPKKKKKKKKTSNRQSKPVDGEEQTPSTPKSSVRKTTDAKSASEHPKPIETTPVSNPPPVSNGPPAVSNVPPPVSNAPPPPVVSNGPPAVGNAPPAVSNVPPAVSNGPPTLFTPPMLDYSKVISS